MAKQNTVECPAVMDITVASDLHARLQAQLAEDAALYLDASGVERIDTACLQLLAALFLDASARSLSITWNHPSPRLVEAAQLLGLEDVLALQDRPAAAADN